MEVYTDEEQEVDCEAIVEDEADVVYLWLVVLLCWDDSGGIRRPRSCESGVFVECSILKEWSIFVTARSVKSGTKFFMTCLWVLFIYMLVVRDGLVVRYDE